MKKTIYCLFLILAVSVASCELPDNIDPKHALDIAPEAVFTQAEIGLVDQIGSINVNSNITRLLVQYHSETTYVTESRYNFSDRQIPDAYFEDLYQEVLMNMKVAYNSLESSLVAAEADIRVRDNKLAVIEVHINCQGIIINRTAVFSTHKSLGIRNIPKSINQYLISIDVTYLDDSKFIISHTNVSFGCHK